MNLRQVPLFCGRTAGVSAARARPRCALAQTGDHDRQRGLEDVARLHFRRADVIQLLGAAVGAHHAVDAHLPRLAAGHADRILLSSNATGASFGTPGNAIPFSHVLTTFVPALRAEGVSEDEVRRILVANPRALLTVEES